MSGSLTQTRRDIGRWRPVRNLGSLPGVHLMITPENTFAPQHNTIAARAREIWESESRPDGRELDHWFQAERELLAPPTTSTPLTPPAKVRSRRKADRVGVSAASSPAGVSSSS